MAELIGMGRGKERKGGFRGHRGCPSKIGSSIHDVAIGWPGEFLLSHLSLLPGQCVTSAYKKFLCHQQNDRLRSSCLGFRMQASRHPSGYLGYVCSLLYLVLDIDRAQLEIGNSDRAASFDLRDYIDDGPVLDLRGVCLVCHPEGHLSHVHRPVHNHGLDADGL